MRDIPQPIPQIIEGAGNVVKDIAVIRPIGGVTDLMLCIAAAQRGMAGWHVRYDQILQDPVALGAQNAVPVSGDDSHQDGHGEVPITVIVGQRAGDVAGHAVAGAHLPRHGHLRHQMLDLKLQAGWIEIEGHRELDVRQFRDRLDSRAA
ncbi:hypothetical protein NKJ35_17510 [Mesorhizobium sp. M0136]|uniref:hypothetical protein n=1 Tax=Mesorhizobium sp. M0136 TaxID=2956890 RepID=UPI003335212F